MDPEQAENPYAPPSAEVVSSGTPATDLGQAEEARLEHLQQEAWVRASGCLSTFGALLGIVSAIWLVQLGALRHGGNSPLEVGVAVVAPALGVALFVIGVGFLRLKPWSRVAGLFVAAGVLPLVPTGTLLGLFWFWLLSSTKGRYVFSQEHAQLRERTRHLKPWPLALASFFGLLLFCASTGALAITFLLP